MSTIVDGCQIEIDRDRGVVYVHGPQGNTLLRICRLPLPIPNSEDLLDITHMHGVSWKLPDTEGEKS